MANEITYSVKLSVLNGNQKDSIEDANKKQDQAATGENDVIQSVGTAAEALDFQTDLGTKGVVYVKNLDSSNYVEIGTGTGGSWVALIRVNPGESHKFRWAQGSTPTAQANTSAVKLRHKTYTN